MEDRRRIVNAGSWSGYHRGLERLVEREETAAKLAESGVEPKHVWSALDAGPRVVASVQEEMPAMNRHQRRARQARHRKGL